MEIWKDIKYYNGYQVSNLGNVKSKRKLLKPEKAKGYLRVTLSINNNQKRFQVHRLVALHFINNKERNPCVNHIDGNKENNNYKNLEWCTYSQNEIHSYNVLKKINNRRKLNDFQVNDIKLNAKKQLNPFDNTSNISFYMKKYNVSRNCILDIINNKSYV